MDWVVVLKYVHDLNAKHLFTKVKLGFVFISSITYYILTTFVVLRVQLKSLLIRDRRNIHILSLLFNALFHPSAPKYFSQRFSYLVAMSRYRLRSNTKLLLACPSRKR